MSEVGQKATLAGDRTMSALPPRTDIEASRRPAHAHAGCAQLAEGDLLRVGRHGWLSALGPASTPSSIGEICDLHDLASGVIGGPFADLFSCLKVA